MSASIEQSYNAEENSLLSLAYVNGKRVYKTTWFRKGSEPTPAEIGREATQHKEEFFRFKAREEDCRLATP